MMNPHDTIHFRCGTGSGAFQSSPFSAFHFLRNYNYFLPQEATEISTKHLRSTSHIFPECPVQSTDAEEPSITSLRTSEPDRSFIAMPQKQFCYWQPGSILQSDLPGVRPSLLSPCGTIFGNHYKRQRGEKKPIPDEQKDDKYFERRKRNNQAAKKSRDARKLREDQVALKAAILEHENTILRAQILTLRDEASTLRQLLMEKKISEF